MLLYIQKPWITRSILILALLGEIAGVGSTTRAGAAPQSRGSFFQSETCIPDSGWVWTNGPARPQLAQEAELALRNEGFEAAVAASDYGEMDACGNFELFSTDFTVTFKDDLQQASDEQVDIAERVRAALQPFGQPQVGNVRIDFGDGAAKSYPDPLRSQDALAPREAASTHSVAASAGASFNKKVLLLVYNPTLSNGQDLSTYMGWTSPMALAQGIIDSFQSASNGQLQYSIVETQAVAGEWPLKSDGFRYTEATYMAAMQNNKFAHTPDEVDYNAIIDNPQFDICGKLNRGEIDELWMYGAPYFGFYESRLVGPGAYSYNSPPMTGTHNCNTLLPIMGLNYERGVAEAIHSFGHRAEATMTRVYGSWQQNRTAHNWDRFGLVKAQSPNYNYSGCGSIHYPHNARSAYDYSHVGITLTNCEDFRNYPNLSDSQIVSQSVSCAVWGCNQLEYIVYWFNHLPSYAGCGPDAVANNWWTYFVDPSLALFPSLNCPPLAPDPILPNSTTRISVNSSGGQSMSESTDAVVSADGRYVVFQSYASNLAPYDLNENYDIFLRDLQTGETTCVSVDPNGIPANGGSRFPGISADGRFIVFSSDAANLVSGDTNGVSDVFIRDLQTAITRRVSVDSSGQQADSYSYGASISADGGYVAFVSPAANLAPGNPSSVEQVYVHDVQNGVTTRVSVSASSAAANDRSISPSISGDGRYVTFQSSASNLVAGDSNGRNDVFVRDLQSGSITRVSVNSFGTQANSDSYDPSISGDGRYIAFESIATNLVPSDTNTTWDIFLHDLQTRITTRVSINSQGVQGNLYSLDASISGDGRFITFASGASNFASGDTNGYDDIFVRDLQAGTITRMSVASGGSQSNSTSFSPSPSSDGQYIVFHALAANLVLNDTNGSSDIFLRRQNIPVIPTVTPTFTPTTTPTKTNTPIFTPTPGSISGNPLYISLANGQTVGGAASADEDILKFDGQNWSLFFDGSDVGVGSPDLSAFSIEDADTILMSFSTAVTVNGISATPHDILQFDVVSLGSATSGIWSMYFDGSDVGFDNTANEKIDSISSLPDGRLLISTTGNPSVPGVSSAKDEDVLAFTPDSLGDVTSGTWAMFFDGSDVGLAETSGEDIDALDVVGSNIYLSAQDAFSVNGASGADEDIFLCSSTALGDVTACTYSPALYFDGSAWGLDANDVDDFNVPASGPPPTVISTATFTPTPTGTIGAPNTPTSTPTSTAGLPDTPTRTPTPTQTATPAPAGDIFTFTPAADAYVNASSPATNYGSSSTLRADASPDLHSYFRFDVQGLNGTVTKATLRVFANSASSRGCTAYGVTDNTWTESALNYNNAPALAGALGSSGSFGAGVWISMDVTAYITGSGTYDLALATASSTAVSLASRESGAHAPQLIVETAP